jgi:hypothetical protein
LGTLAKSKVSTDTDRTGGPRLRVCDGGHRQVPGGAPGLTAKIPVDVEAPHVTDFLEQFSGD